MSFTEEGNVNPREICEVCGIRAGMHRGSDGRCPASNVEPKWPVTVEKKKGVEAAGKLYDARIAKFFSKRKTNFKRAMRFDYRTGRMV